MVVIKRDTKIINVDEAAKLYGVSRTRIWQFVQAGRLTPIIREKRTLLFDEADVIKLKKLNAPLKQKYGGAYAD